jgi:ATP-binding cassette subfamily C protein
MHRPASPSGAPAPGPRLSESDALDIESAIAELLARESRREAQRKAPVVSLRDRVSAAVVAPAPPISPARWPVAWSPAEWRTSGARLLSSLAAYLMAAVDFVAARLDRRVNSQAGRIASGTRGDVRAALDDCKRAFWSVAVFSGVVNLLMLAGPLYMLQVYDRVLSSRSIPTLVGLSFFLVLAFAFQGALDIIRTRIVIRAALVLDEHLGTTVHRAVMRLGLETRRTADAHQPVRDLDQIRGFMTGAAPIAIVDLPWMPLFLIICCLIHPLLGLISFLGGALLLGLTVLTERASRVAAREVAQGAGTRSAMLEGDRRNSETIAAMGMAPALTSRWEQLNTRYLAAAAHSNEVMSSYGTFSRMVRLLLQSIMLGLGAFLVIRDELSTGGMIAASIMMTRALAPVETIIANWRGFVTARTSIHRLSQVLERVRPTGSRTGLPKPKHSLDVERLAVALPGAQRAIVANVQFGLVAGEALGILGASGTGKTSLVRTLVGIWPPAGGGIRLDAAALDQWEPETRGRYVGYVSQNVELFDGTIAENISRMAPNADSRAVLRAAHAAGAHDMILRLPAGYDTNIGEMGATLSGGQRQRIALARALYGDPFLVVLDEPHANLDGAGEAALRQAIRDLKARGAIVVLIAHQMSILSDCDKILLLGNGTQQAFGPRDEVWRKLTGHHLAPVAAAGTSRVMSDRGSDR